MVYWRKHQGEEEEWDGRKIARRNLAATIKSHRDLVQTILAMGVLEAFFFDRRNLTIRSNAQIMETNEDTTIMHCPSDSGMV